MSEEKQPEEKKVNPLLRGKAKQPGVKRAGEHTVTLPKTKDDDARDKDNR